MIAPASGHVSSKSAQGLRLYSSGKSSRAVFDRPQELFEDNYDRSPIAPGLINWAAHPDGRFIFMRSVASEQGEGGRVVYIQNWRAKLVSLFVEEGAEQD